MYPNNTCFTNTYTFLIFELGPYTLSIPIHRRHQLWQYNCLSISCDTCPCLLVVCLFYSIVYR